MWRIILFFLISVILSTTAFADEQKKLQILTTIKPVSMLVSAIAGDKADIQQLIPDYSSPHNYSFKPSDIRRIKKADIVFSIDEHLEAIIFPVLEQYAPKDQLILLAESEGIHLMSMSGKHGHGHSHGSEDLHIWTSPKNALLMAQTIATKLVALDNRNKGFYSKNLSDFELNLKETTQEIKNQLAPFKSTPYLVFNNNWRYFAHTFGLKNPQTIVRQEGLSSNIKSILQARAQLSKSHISCLVSDPSISSARINVITENLAVKHSEIDILGSHISIKPNAYIQWLNGMSEKIINCLKAP